MQGFLLINKPAGITSHDVVNRVRRLTGEKRVGHAGTLDPFATGLLIVGVGRGATKEMNRFVGLDKRYEAVFILGAQSDTDDKDGKIEPAPLKTIPEGKESLEKILAQFVGELEQIPPSYSAIKVGGKKMYEAARAGKPIEAKARKVTVYSIDLTNASTVALGAMVDKPSLSLKIHCSSGTYIRAIARDLGKTLGGGGYVEELKRTSIGPFSLDQSYELESLRGSVEQALIPVEKLIEYL
jgi:tRNA pseudouridine55 synthase